MHATTVEDAMDIVILLSHICDFQMGALLAVALSQWPNLPLHCGLTLVEHGPCR
jgi:hypothetical protein